MRSVLHGNDEYQNENKTKDTVGDGCVFGQRDRRQSVRFL